MPKGAGKEPRYFIIYKTKYADFQRVDRDPIGIII